MLGTSSDKYRGEKPEFENGSEAMLKEKFPALRYFNVAGLCKAATIEEIGEVHGWSLNPGRYVGVSERAADEFDFYERLEELNEDLETLNAEKTARARAELESIATALESYRRERGAYLESKSKAALIDNLNPRYLARIIRVDPWHQPYEYEGSRTSFVLRSAGPDEKPNTADDVTVLSGAR